MLDDYEGFFDKNGDGFGSSESIFSFLTGFWLDFYVYKTGDI